MRFPLSFSVSLLAALLCFACVTLAGVKNAAAHAMPIALFSLKEVKPNEFLLSQIDPGVANDKQTPVVNFPQHCHSEPPLLKCPNRGLFGTITVEDFGKDYTAVVIRIQWQSGRKTSYTLTEANRNVVLGTGGTASFSAIVNLAWTYMGIGFEHILLGVDHLLFVLGLVWLVRSRWMLVKTITSFTVAHSFTLAAATLGWVGVPERPVNAIIALSIVFVGVEIIKYQRGQEGLTVRHPWVVAFAFGLLHGFGFSNALTQLGLPQDSILLALLSFNVGVEIGQIAFVFVVLAMQWAHQTLHMRFHPKLDPVPAYAIGSIAMFWFIGRMSEIITI